MDRSTIPQRAPVAPFVPNTNGAGAQQPATASADAASATIGLRPASASDPVARSLSDATRAGRLVSSNARRSGLIVGNLTDGTLLLAFAADEASAERFTVAIGPAQTWTMPPEALYGGEIRYRFADAADAAGFPAGLVLAATSGRFTVTELTTA